MCLPNMQPVYPTICCLSLLIGMLCAPSADCGRTIPTYLALFIFAFLFDIALSWDAIRLQNTIQVLLMKQLSVGHRSQHLPVRNVDLLGNPNRSDSRFYTRLSCNNDA
jgi:hypothetical protein